MADEEKEKKEEVTKATEPKAGKAEKPAKEEKAKKEEKTEKKEEKEEEKPKVKKTRSRAKKRSVPEGAAHIQASYNNTIVTLTEPNGDVIAWSSAGASGFKGARKATPYAAQVSAENAAAKAAAYGLERVHVYVKGVGTGREQAIRGLVASGINIISINDITPMPHNGCRKKKQRRI